MMQTRNLDEDVRARLRELLEDHPQAEIARKTGFGKHNVSRYLSGTKIPAEFCSAVISGLGVNPAWLMAGEGTPYLSDVTGGTAKMAGNLLELVHAMSEVAKMRLGALAGRTHLKVLRQLDDALRDYERLRSSLNEQSRPFLQNLLGDYAAAVRKHELDRAQHLRRAAHQMNRLCDDEELARELTALDAYVEFQNQNGDEALRLQRRVFLGFLGSTRVDERVLVEGFNYARVLSEAGYFDAAYDIARATLALGRGLESRSRFQSLRAQCGWLQIELGELQSGLPILLDALPRLAEREARTMWGELIRGQLIAGTIGWRAGIEIGINGVSRSSTMVRWAFFEGEPEAIHTVLGRFVGNEPWQVLPGSAFLEALRARAEIREGDRSAYNRWRDESFTPQLRRATPRQTGYTLHVQNATLALEAGDKKAAQAVLKAEQAFTALPAEVRPSILWLAQHCSNVLQVSAGSEAKELRKAAAREQERLEQWHETGYLGLHRVTAAKIKK